MNDLPIVDLELVIDLYRLAHYGATLIPFGISPEQHDLLVRAELAIIAAGGEVDTTPPEWGLQ